MYADLGRQKFGMHVLDSFDARESLLAARFGDKRNILTLALLAMTGAEIDNPLVSFPVIAGIGEILIGGNDLCFGNDGRPVLLLFDHEKRLHCVPGVSRFVAGICIAMAEDVPLLMVFEKPLHVLDHGSGALHRFTQAGSADVEPLSPLLDLVRFDALFRGPGVVYLERFHGFGGFGCGV